MTRAWPTGTRWRVGSGEQSAGQGSRSAVGSTSCGALLLAARNEGCDGEGDPGVGRSREPEHHPAVHALVASGEGERDPRSNCRCPGEKEGRRRLQGSRNFGCTAFSPVLDAVSRDSSWSGERYGREADAELAWRQQISAAWREQGRRPIEPLRRGRLKRLSTCPRDAAILQVASRVFAARSSLRRGARRRRRASWNDARRTASSRGGGLPSGRRLAPYPPSFWLHGAVTVPAGDPAREP